VRIKATCAETWVASRSSQLNDDQPETGGEINARLPLRRIAGEGDRLDGFVAHDLLSPRGLPPLA